MAGGLVGLPDGALVERHLRGESGLEELYVKYHPKLLDYCMGITRDRARAEDLAHDTIVRAIARFDRFDSQRKILPWLKVIASRQAIDGRRRRSHELLIDPGDWAAPDDERERECVEHRSVLGLALAQLSHRHREALALRYIQDLDCAGAADRLDISRSAYEQLLARARQRLREEYRKLNKAILSVFAPVMAAWRRAKTSVGDAAASQWARLDPSAAVSAVMGSTAASLSVAALVAVGGGPGVASSGDSSVPFPPSRPAVDVTPLVSWSPWMSPLLASARMEDANAASPSSSGAGTSSPVASTGALTGAPAGASGTAGEGSTEIGTGSDPARASVGPPVSGSQASKEGSYEDGTRYQLAPIEVEADLDDAPDQPAAPGQPGGPNEPSAPAEPDEPDLVGNVGASYECVPEEQRSKDQLVVCPVLDVLSS